MKEETHAPVQPDFIPNPINGGLNGAEVPPEHQEMIMDQHALNEFPQYNDDRQLAHMFYSNNPAEQMHQINMHIKNEEQQHFDQYGNQLYDLHGQKVTKMQLQLHYIQE